jgi:dTMP kinase
MEQVVSNDRRSSAKNRESQEGNILSRTTLSLFYATDFADQLEKHHSPGVSRFHRAADRYIYTLMGRDMVRGMDEAWWKTFTGWPSSPMRCFT